jgi:hypothetical protein
LDDTDRQVVCAKCTRGRADADACQDVPIVTDAREQTEAYNVSKNAVLEEFGRTRKGEQPAVVTGSVAEKDGKTWITPTKMEKKG